MHINARTVRAALSSGIDMAKETYLDGKRDLFRWQKRPIYMEKHTSGSRERGEERRRETEKKSKFVAELQ